MGTFVHHHHRHNHGIVHQSKSESKRSRSRRKSSKSKSRQKQKQRPTATYLRHPGLSNYTPTTWIPRAIKAGRPHSKQHNIITLQYYHTTILQYYDGRCGFRARSPFIYNNIILQYYHITIFRRNRASDGSDVECSDYYG